MQVNQPKGSAAEATTTPFATGDRVSYVAISSEGGGYRFSARKGVIVEINGNVEGLTSEYQAARQQKTSKVTGSRGAA